MLRGRGQSDAGSVDRGEVGRRGLFVHPARLWEPTNHFELTKMVGGCTKMDLAP